MSDCLKLASKQLEIIEYSDIICKLRNAQTHCLMGIIFDQKITSRESIIISVTQKYIISVMTKSECLINYMKQTLLNYPFYTEREHEFALVAYNILTIEDIEETKEYKIKKCLIHLIELCKQMEKFLKIDNTNVVNIARYIENNFTLDKLYNHGVII